MMEELIFTRELENDKDRVVIDIFKPICSEHLWTCKIRILWSEVDFYEMNLTGVDGLDSFFNALKIIRAKITSWESDTGEKLTWIGGTDLRL